MNSSRELPNGRVTVDGGDRGGGFAVQPRLAITAAHVIEDNDASAIRYSPFAGEEVQVAAVEVIRELDVAVLRLTAEVPVRLRAGRALEGARFHVDANPRANDPRLTGIIQAVRWPVTLSEGYEANVVQLGLDHPLGDYAGYSGCAVSSPTDTAVGVLVEQLPDRVPRPRTSRSAPLLYAMPIETVLEALGLNVVIADTKRPPTVAGSAVASAWTALAPPGVQRDFVARDDELAALVQSWRALEEAVLLHGLPGAGKSALAAEAAVLAEREFPDGVLYIDMRGLEDVAVDVDAALDQLLDALDVPPEPRPSAPAQKSALLGAALEGRRILLILDDVRDEEQARPLRLRSEACSTLITSRSVLPALEAVSRIEIGALGLTDGVHLLERLVGRERVEADRWQAERLVGFCGGLPLAMRITGGRLATRPAWSIREYADLLADELVRLQRLRLGDLDVRASFELSYRLLHDDEQRGLRHIGLLHSAAVAVEAVSAALGNDARDALEGLADAGLVTPQQERYEVHELIRLFARGLLSGAEQTDGLVRLGGFYVDEVERQIVALRAGAGPAALRWASAERATLERLPGDLAGAGRDDLVIELVLAVGPLYVPLHAWTAWERALRVGLASAERQGEQDGALRMQHNIAVLLGKLGREQESRQLLERVMAEAREIGNVGLEARALAQLGQIAKQDGRPQDAVELLDASCKAYRRADEAHGLAQALRDLANALDDLGRHEDALERHRDAFERFAAIGDRYSQGLELGNAGIALHRLDRLEEAADAHRASIVAFETVGAEIAGAVATRRLAEVMWALGDEAEGEGSFAAALLKLEAADETHERAELLAAREGCLVQAGRLEEALADARRAAELYAAAGDHRAEASERVRLGFLRGQLGDEDAVSDLVRAEELFTQAGDRPSGVRAHALSQQAFEAVHQRDTATALSLWRRADDMYAEAGSVWSSALMLHSAAPMLEDAGDHAGAIELLERLGPALEVAEASPLPPLWPAVSVRGVTDRIRRALLSLWVVQAAEAANSADAREIEVVSPSLWPPDLTMHFDATRMQLRPDALSRTEFRDHLRLGWHIHSMFGGQELMRRDVRADDELGAFLLDVAGEWLAVQQFQEEPGTPMFRSASAPATAGDVRPLGSALGAALAGSSVQRQEVEEWISRHHDSRFACIARDLLGWLPGVSSPQDLFDALAGYYRHA